MRIVRSFPFAAFALVLLSIIGYCIAEPNVGLLLVAGALAAISWYVTEGPRGRYLPKWASNLLAVGFTLNVLVQLAQGISTDLLERGLVIGNGLGQFVVLIALVKLYERKSPRDYAHLLLMSLLLMILGCRSQALLFGIVLLLYTIIGLYVLILFQLYLSYQRSRDVRAALHSEGEAQPVALRPVFGRNFFNHFRRLVIGVGLCAVACGTMLFVAVPRGTGVGILASTFSRPIHSTVGFTDHVDLLLGTRITETSTTPVMTVQVRDAHGNPVHSITPMHLRGAVNDEYARKGRWRYSSRYETTLNASPDAPLPLNVTELPLQNVRTFDVRVLTRSPSQRMFSVYPPMSLSCEHSQTVEFDPVARLLRWSSDAVIDRYIVETQRPVDTSLLIDGPHHNPRRLNLPEPIRRIARQWLADDGLAARPPRRNSAEYWHWAHQTASAFERRLESSEFQYTLDLSDVSLSHADDFSDPIVRFLTDFRRGHCEYFASALTALCQSVGVEARMALGYLMHEYDPAFQHYVVRDAHAHAWVEVRTGERTWSVFDPSPTGAVLEAHDIDADALGGQIRQMYDRFDHTWKSNFVEFDFTAQTRLIQSIETNWTQMFKDMLHSLWRWLDRWHFDLGVPGLLWIGTVIFAGVLAIIAGVQILRRIRMMRRELHLEHLHGAEFQRVLSQSGFYLDMLRVLSRCGLAKPSWQPPLDYALELQQTRPHVSGIVADLTSQFYAVRYGHGRLSKEERSAVDEQIRRLAEALKRST